MDSAFKVIGIGENEFDRIISSRDAFISITKCLFMCLVSENDGLRYVAAELLRHIANVVHFRDDEVHEDEEVWKTIKGTHVLIDDDGNITKGPEALKNLGKEKSTGISKEMKPENDDYDYEEGDDIQDFMHKNVEKLRPIYEKGRGAAIDSEFYKFRLARSTKDVHQISKAEADEVVYDNVRQSLYDGWFRAADSSYKPALVSAMLSSPEMRNAGLSLAYENYKNCCIWNNEEPLDFETFLVTPVKMYRGGYGQKHTKDDVFSAYTFDRKTAEHFASNGNGEHIVTEAMIRPIDTYGSMRAVGESEIWVPREIAPNGNRDEADVHDDGVFFAGELNHVKNGEYDVEYPDKKFG